MMMYPWAIDCQPCLLCDKVRKPTIQGTSMPLLTPHHSGKMRNATKCLLKITGSYFPLSRAALSQVIAALLLSVFAVSTLAEKGDGVLDAGESREEELARAAQNPVASLISVPIQNNTNFDFGPREKTQNVMNVQPENPI
jgi:hypothetical protein